MDESYAPIVNDYMEVQTIYETHPVSITATVFDTQQELLWVGTSEVSVRLFWHFWLDDNICLSTLTYTLNKQI